MKTRRIAFRSLANGKIVCADAGGDSPLIANRDGIGPWETFELIELDEGNGYPAPGPQPAPIDPPSVPVQPPRPAPAPSPPGPSGSGGLVLSRTVQVTNDLDGEFMSRMYSYWPNAVIRDGLIYVFAVHVDGSPRFFLVSRDGSVARLGPLLPYRTLGEGWYFDAEAWVYLIDGPRLRRVNPLSGEDRVVFSIEQTHPGCELWQAHSSDDGTVHSATVHRVVSDGAYPRIGTVVCRGRDQQFFEAHGDLDESHLTGNGRFLIIEEDNNNRIVDLHTGQHRQLLDAEGAVSHCDTGWDFIVGEDNFVGACVRWDLDPPARRMLFATWGMGHLSVRGGVCLLSDSTHLSLVSLNGGGVVSFLAHGMTGSDYDHQVKANVDPSGRVACYMSNQGGSRYDVFLAPVPQ